jgi:hypothetical protein
MAGLPFRLPPLEALLLRTRALALGALRGAGWRPWATPSDLDAERRRLLNVDLSEPEVAWPDPAGGTLAVAHLEVDRTGQVELFELTAAVPVPAASLAAALLPRAGEPRVGGGAEAREWVWGPEAGNGGEIGGEPVRLWVCAERAYGDRLWAIASLVRHGTEDGE